ncbi:hypothetical protein JCM11491_000236 [Sporobolomyces phaffii]
MMSGSQARPAPPSFFYTGLGHAVNELCSQLYSRKSWLEVCPGLPWKASLVGEPQRVIIQGTAVTEMKLEAVSVRGFYQVSGAQWITTHDEECSTRVAGPRYLYHKGSKTKASEPAGGQKFREGNLSGNARTPYTFRFSDWYDGDGGVHTFVLTQLDPDAARTDLDRQNYVTFDVSHTHVSSLYPKMTEFYRIHFVIQSPPVYSQVVRSRGQASAPAFSASVHQPTQRQPADAGAGAQVVARPTRVSVQSMLN